MVSTTPPSGFRDFLNEEARLRLELIHRISQIYMAHGFQPLETPALENLDVLLGSGGGEENEKLIFKILKRGDKLKEALTKVTAEGGEDEIADFGLRFDMTVPLSRVAAQYRGQIVFPWKVFHIGPVWRAERAQKGRFREFMQCDVDIVGAKTWAAEVEVIQSVVHAVDGLGLGKTGFEIRLNDRRLLQAIASQLGLEPAAFQSFAILLDKKDKMEPSELEGEMKSLLGSKWSEVVQKILREELSLEEASALAPDVSGDLTSIIRTLRELQLPLENIIFDPSLVRGLGYYTGPVFELRHSSAGYSFGGGGRYDRLIGRFSKDPIPACGMSIGFERLFLLLKEAKTQQEGESKNRRLFIPVMNESLRSSLLKIASTLRAQDLEVDVFPDEAKLKSQLKFASDRNYRWVCIIGEDELKSKILKLKDMTTGEEKSVPLSSPLRPLL